VIDEKELQKKLKNLKDVYRRELAKVRKSETTGTGTSGVYKPSLSWFEVADGFLRDYVQTRAPRETGVS
jgi:hypothetical protein